MGSEMCIRDRKNIMLAPVQLKLMSEEEANKKALELLERVGLSDKADTYPNMLSGGQKQRVAIARAIVNNPSVILADEPTGNLDTKMSVEIMDLFTRLNRELKRTIILVTHEEDIALYADRIIKIVDGEISVDQAVKKKTARVVKVENLELEL